MGQGFGGGGDTAVRGKSPPNLQVSYRQLWDQEVKAGRDLLLHPGGSEVLGPWLSEEVTWESRPL